MVAIADFSEKGRKSLAALHNSVIRAWRRFGKILARSMPKGLYTRALIIIIAPMILLQSVITFVFLDRHWQQVTKRLSTATVRDIAMVIASYEAYQQNDDHQKLVEMARNKLGLVMRILPPQDLPAPRPRPFFGLLDRTLSKQIRRRIGLPFWIDTVGKSDHVEIRIKLKDAVLQIFARRSQTYASKSYIFLVWMMVTSTVLVVIAVLFLRNQVRPIVTLAHAADRFGRGLPAPKELRMRGAREVRLATKAFLEMRDRIERHVEQRTTMLAGVSHDLRTVLTRFRLQLAMLGDDAPSKSLRSDVVEMQQMLEDYMAFAKGDHSEACSHFDLYDVLEEVSKDVTSVSGKPVHIVSRRRSLAVSLRRNAIKRAVLNLASNAARFGEQIEIHVIKTRQSLRISVEDDGPGIPKKERENVFRPFYCLDNARNQNVKTTGLGLAITRDIVRGHGGEISLEESRLGGLKAMIEIPV